MVLLKSSVSENFASECGTRGPGIDVTAGHARIIEGYEAEEGAWPWQIGLVEFG